MKIENLEKANSIRARLREVEVWGAYLQKMQDRSDQDATGDWLAVEVARERVSLPLSSFKVPIRAFLTLAMDEVKELKTRLLAEVENL